MVWNRKRINNAFMEILKNTFILLQNVIEFHYAKEKKLLLLKKILVGLLVVAYPLTLQSSDVFAKKSTTRSSKKKTSKKKRVVKSNSKTENSDNLTESENNSSETSNGSVATTTVSTSATTSVATNTNTTSSSSEQETAPTATGEIKDMSKDAKWEEFRLCMQTSCAGSDTQPNNVECYKSINFDNVFSNCKMLVEESKREDYKNYFTGPFIKAEKKAFCEGDNYGGKFEEATGKCAITVKYIRPAYNGKQFQCGRESRAKTWYLDNRNYVCDADLFGVGECYQDSPEYAAAQTQKWIGIAQIGIGVLSAAATGISAAKKGIVKNSTTTTNADGSSSTNVTYEKYTNKKGVEVNKADVAGGISAGLTAGSGMLAAGGESLAKGLVIEKDSRGNRIFGNCTLPNGETISEGNSIKLSW